MNGNVHVHVYSHIPVHVHGNVHTCTYKNNKLITITNLKEVLHPFWFITIALSTNTLNFFHLSCLTCSLGGRTREHEMKIKQDLYMYIHVARTVLT